MSNDKTIRIGIETKSDTSGAKQAASDIEDVKDKAQEADAALKQTDSGGIRNISQDAKPAAGSIDALEAEVRQLQSELNKLPVGSQQFVVMAGRVKQAQVNLGLAEAEARKLAGTIGRKGNLGMAVLEASRAVEDAQYGIGGTLNNLPGLIAMLGGSAGLAGVISLIAVSGKVAWDVMSKGSKDAQKDTTDWLELFKKLSDEFGNQALEMEKSRGKSFDRLLEDQKKFAAEQQRLADSEGRLVSERIKGDGGVAIARERYELTKLDAELVNATGDKAIRLAAEREIIIKRIADLEKGIVESIREQELAVAQSKVNNAQGSFVEADTLKDDAAARSVSARQAADAAAELLANAVAGRAKTLEALTTERFAAISQRSSASNPLEELRLTGLIDRLQKGIEAASKPGKLEAELKVGADNARAASKEAADNFTTASEKQQQAADALKVAAEGLSNLQLSQGQQRKNEGEMEALNQKSDLDQKIRENGEKAAKELETSIADALKNMGDAAKSPEVTSIVSQLRRMGADGIDAGEQNQVTMLFQQLIARSQAERTENVRLMEQFFGIVDRSVAAITRYSARADEYDRRLRVLELNDRR